MDRVVLTFAKEDCRCNRPLFDLKYLRTHRANSVKLIRCFPHCCPSHSYANFCATSMDLRVSNATPDVENDIAVVRFQTTSEIVYKIGDQIDAQEILMNLRRYDDNKAEWIPSEYQHYNKATQTMTYRFNHKNNLGWHYGWMGTSTKAHRTCTHQGYLLRKTASGQALSVVAVTTSPPFIVMSYRRACYHCQKHREADNEGLSTPSSGVCECEGEFNVMQGLSISSSPPVNQPSIQANAAPRSIPRAVPAVDSNAMERQLAILYGFLQLPPAHVFTAQVQAKRLMAVPPVLTRFLPSLAPTNSNDLMNLKSCCIDMLLSTIGSFDILAQNIRQFAQSTSYLFVRGDLNQSYITWLVGHYHALNSRLNSLGTSIAHLTSRITLAASNTPELQSFQAYLESLDQLDMANSSGFDYYVAQLREAEGSLRTQMSVIYNYQSRWMFEKMRGHRFNESCPESDPSILTLLRCITMGYCFEMRLTDTALLLHSDLHAFNTVWSEFVFDQVPRVFRVFPNGESSMAPFSPLQHGDYIAYRHDQSITLRLFCWPEICDKSRICYSVVLQFSLLANTLDVSVFRSYVAGPVDVANMFVEERCRQYLDQHEIDVLQVSIQYKPISPTCPANPID
ncbi:hypothetical protein THRCLA_09417 [Thraustotheca clavata]|uniref:Uncharacterized protein n=1 Tax=Thraustotheca clavata TaxID=74557 RepID=A0A1V9YXA9_9STRA|nr:hypothetical protein THRCLA_09417 [Thraustotheca clavata]